MTLSPGQTFARWPWGLSLAAIGLALVGVAAIGRADELAPLGTALADRQTHWLLLSIALVGLAAWPSQRLVAESSYALMAGAALLLVVIFLRPAINGAHRWLAIGPVGVQPSEFTKLAYVLALARYLRHRESYRRMLGLVAPLALTLLPMLLILKEPDLGTALVFVPVLFAMLLAAGARVRDLARLALLGALVVPLLWTQMSREQRSRVTALWDQPGPWESPSDDAYQLHRAKQVLCLGATWGSWIGGDSSEEAAALHLPAAQTDFIFALVGERFGLVGCALTLLMYVVLIERMIAIARHSSEPFARLMVAGIASLFAVQVLINTFMAVGLAPVTGLSLPLVSYGGSGLATHALSLGLVINVALRPGYELAPEPFRFRKAEPNKLRRTAGIIHL